MKQTIKIGKIKLLSLLKHALLINAVLVFIYCAIMVILKWDLISEPPSVMIGSSNVNMSPWPYIVRPLIFLWFDNFIILTILEVAAIGTFNFIAQHTGGIEVDVRLRDKDI